MLLLLLQGKLQVEERGAQGFSQPHNFVPHLFVPPSNCDHCYQMIIGILSKGECSKIDDKGKVFVKSLKTCTCDLIKGILHCYI